MQWCCKAKQSEPCTLSSFNKVINDPKVSATLGMIRDVANGKLLAQEQLIAVGVKDTNFNELAMEDKVRTLKNTLPVFCFLATFNNGARKTENATPTGLVFLDLDHIGDAREAWSALEEKAIKKGCVLAHITPSGEGLRIVFQRPQGKSVSEAIQWYAEQIGVTEEILGEGKLDTQVKDLARCSFAVSADYILYRDDEALFESETSFTEPNDEILEPEVEEVPAGEMATPEQLRDLKFVQPEKVNNYPTCYREIPYADIVSVLLEQEGFPLENGLPQMGNRHNAMIYAADMLRYICDFDADFLMAVIPNCGLPKDEMYGICKSAVAYEPGRFSRMPKKLSNVINRLEWESKKANGEINDAEEEDTLPMPAKLPKSIKKILKAYPENMRPAILFGILPVLGTLATRVRAKYYDERMHSLSFLSCIVAPQAGGKGNVINLCIKLLRKLQLFDDLEMQKLIDYEYEKEAKKNDKEQPVNPRPCIRIIPEKTSNTSLSELLDNARGQHIICVTPEIDSLAKNNKAAWSGQDDIQRKAFDNDRLGQYYCSNQSHKSRAHVYYNIVAAGTPMAVRRYFNNVEGGLISRYCFAQLPSTYGKNIQRMGIYSEKDEAEIQNMMLQLMKEGASKDYSEACGGVFTPRMKAQLNEDGTDVIEVEDEDQVPTVVYYLPKLVKAMSNWQEERTHECLKENNDALDTLRRRAGVIGFRAGVLYFCMEGHKLTSEVIALARWTADKVLDEQLRLFGNEINELSQRNREQIIASDARVNRHKPHLFDALPNKFDYAILRETCEHYNESTNDSTLRNYALRWKKAGWIKQLDKGSWIKCS